MKDSNPTLFSTKTWIDANRATNCSLRLWWIVLLLLLVAPSAIIAAPDLCFSVPPSAAPNPVTAGSTVAINVSIKNIGNTTAAASTTKAQIKPANSSALTIESVFSTPTIAANSLVGQSFPLTIPAGTTAGTYTAYLILDNNNAAGQASTTQSNDRASVNFSVAAANAAPTVTTNGASGVGSASTTLNATVNPNGGATTGYFQFGLTTSYGATTSAVNLGNGTGGTPFQASTGPIAPGATFHYRAVAYNAGGTNYGQDASFYTPPLPPSVTDNPPTSVTTTSAQFNATLNPNGADTTAYFQYGTTASYGLASGPGKFGSGTSPFGVLCTLSGAMSNTTYHYRLVASNSAGTAYGNDVSFTTLPAAQAPPSVATLAAESITSSSAVIKGSTVPNGTATTAYFQYGLTESYDHATSAADCGSGTTALGLQAVLTGLEANTRYHYRLVASNRAGVANGPDASFATAVDTNVPTLSAISPDSVVGAPERRSFTLTGSNFAVGARVQVGFASNHYAFADTTEAATRVSGTQLTVNLNTTTQPDTWNVRVVNPAGQTSNVLTLQVTGPQGVIPTVTGISPSLVTGSDSTQTFTINGSNFVPGAKVQVGFRDNQYQFQDTSRAATVVNASQLTVPIITGKTLDTWQVRVVNADGHVSNTYTFQVAAATNTLTITGPASVAAGSTTNYRVLFGQTDVTDAATLSFAQTPPSYAAIGNFTLSIDTTATAGTVYLQASYTDGGNRYVSGPFPINVATSFTASFSEQHQSDGSGGYTGTLTGSAQGGAPPYTFRWDTNNDSVFGDKTGSPVNYVPPVTSGPYTVALEVTDAKGNTARASSRITLNKPPVPSEPVQSHLNPDPASGRCLNEGGNPYSPDPDRIHHGLIIVTHGLTDTGTDPWLTHPYGNDPHEGDGMVQRLESRLARDVPGTVPNIMIYDWTSDANPVGDINPGLEDSLEFLAESGIELELPWAAVAAEAALLTAEPIRFLINIAHIRTAAMTDGQFLAEWIIQHADAGEIDPDKPIHLIGHSAGGFVMAECALYLRQPNVKLKNGKRITVDRVTMLDTPGITQPEVTTLPNPTYVERYLSSIYGWLACSSVRNAPTGQFYTKVPIPQLSYLNLDQGDNGHGFSHRWYNYTIDSRSGDNPAWAFFGDDGFAHSPFLGGPKVLGHSSRRTATGQNKTAMLAGETSQSLDGFTTFGNASLSNGEWTFTEQADAGIFKHITMPVGIRALQMSFKFAVGGDGDFLQVRFGDSHVLYIAADTSLSRGGYLSVEVPLSGLDHLTDDLVITLVSRGQANAVAQVADLALVVSDDADDDGLTSEQEVVYGTDPLRADTDGDGVNDGDEIAAGTNPLDPASAPMNSLVLPVVSSASDAAVNVGQPFTYQITATNHPMSFGADNLPTGLSVDASTGLISGTITTADTYSIALHATNAAGTGFATLTMTAKTPDNQVIYDDALQNGWQNYSWATVDYGSTETVHQGVGISVRVDMTNYQGFYLHHAPFNSSPYASLSFWIHGGPVGGQNLRVQGHVGGKEIFPGVTLSPPQANTWTKVTVPLADLGAANQSQFDGFWIQDNSLDVQGTFYVDDITLNGNPAPASVQLQADAANVIRQIDGRIFGVNTAIWDTELGQDATYSLLARIGAKSLRFPGGRASDDYDWQLDRSVINGTFQWAGSFPVFARLAESLGAQPYLTVNYGSGTPEQAAAWVAYANGDPASTLALGTDAKGRDWRTVGYWASLRASAPLANDDGSNFLRIGHPAGFGFWYWEVGNECYGDWESDEHRSGGALGGVSHDPYTYAQAFALFRQKMLAVDPTVRLGAVVIDGQDRYGNGQHGVLNPHESSGTAHTGWTPVLLANLKASGALPHFLSFHDYPQEPGQESDPGLLTAAASMTATDAAGLRGLLNDYVGGVEATAIELALTEVNSVTYDPGKQSVSLVDGLFYAETLASLAATEFNACQWWDLRNGGVNGTNDSDTLYGVRQFGDYGLLASGDRADTPADTPYPAFRAAELLARWAQGGDRVVAGASNYPSLSIHACLRVDGRLCLLVINKSIASDLTVRITLGGFVPGANTATIYRYGKAEEAGGGGLTTGVLANVSGSFLASFPAYSMTVIDLVKPLSPYAAWQSSHFTASELAAPGVSGDLADPDGDGIVNLLEYALNLNPRAFDAGGLPTPASVILNGNNFLTLTYTKPKAATDLAYTVEVSSDLATWFSGSGYTEDVSVIDQGTTQQITTRDLTPIIAGSPHRFMRLRIIRP